MIVIDTSAIVAILFQEEDAYSYAEKIQQSEMCFMSAATLVELCAVLKKKKGKEYVDVVYSFIKESGIKIEPFSYDQAQIATQAYCQFSILNMGDSYSYALAKDKGLPLLFKGNDFGKTDLMLA